MILTKKETDWVRKNEQIIISILEKRISDLKDQILDVPDEKRDSIIQFIKEYKTGLGLLKELTSDKKSEDWTGI